MREETYREKGGERSPVGKRKGGVDGESDRETKIGPQVLHCKQEK